MGWPIQSTLPSVFTWYQALSLNSTMGSPTASASSSAALTTLLLPASFGGPPASAVPPPSASLITAKLTSSNFISWKAQILPPHRIANATGYVDGTELPPDRLLPADDKGVRAPNPEYATWFCQDQIVLSYLLASLTDEILQQVHRFTTSRAIWEHLEEMYQTHCRASIVQIKLDMAIFKKENLSMAEYLANADQLDAVGRAMRAEDRWKYALEAIIKWLLLYFLVHDNCLLFML